MLTLISDMKLVADAVEKLAFEIPAPNPYTPQFASIAITARKLAAEADERRRANFKSKLEVNEAASKIMDILRDLQTPRHAAAAVAVVRANLHRQAGGDTEDRVRSMIADDDKAALEMWGTISGITVGASH